MYVCMYIYIYIHTRMSCMHILMYMCVHVCMGGRSGRARVEHDLHSLGHHSAWAALPDLPAAPGRVHKPSSGRRPVSLDPSSDTREFSHFLYIQIAETCCRACAHVLPACSPTRPYNCINVGVGSHIVISPDAV